MLLAVLSIALAAIAAPPAPEARPDRRISPDETLVLIAADLATLTPEAAAYTRYLSLRAVEPADQEDLAKLATVTLHELSRSRGIYPLVDARIGGLAVVRVGSLLRFQTIYFGETFARQWERLGGPDPFYHGDDLRLTNGFKLVEYGHWELQGQYVEKGTAGSHWVTVEHRKEPTEEKVTSQHGAFVRTEAGKAAMLYIQSRLVNPTNGRPGSDVPVVDADWFISQALLDYQRDPGYHDFLGFNNQAEWERLVGLVRDPKVIDEVYLTELREAVGHPGPGTKDTLRRILHYDKPAGDVWFTQDVNLREAKLRAKDNPLSNPGDDFAAQAVEALGHLVTGFVAKGLFDGKGVRQDRAPDFIATDKTAPYNDTRIHTGLCFRCHETGFQGFKSWYRDMQNFFPNFAAIKDPKLRFQAQEHYVVGRLEPHLERSRERYATALKLATGQTPQQHSAALGRIWKKYVEDDVTADMAARRMGITQAQLYGLLTCEPLAKDMKAKGATEAEIAEAVRLESLRHEPNLAALRPDSKETLPSIVWQTVFQRAVDVQYGITRPFSVKESRK